MRNHYFNQDIKSEIYSPYFNKIFLYLKDKKTIFI